MLEWIRFGFVAALIVCALALETMAVFGMNRFRFSLNRLHAAAIGDTLCMSLMVLSGSVFVGLDFLALKLLLVVSFMWLTSPISGHLISYLIYVTDERLDKEARLWNN